MSETPDYRQLESLNFEAAFADPLLLIKAVRAACPEYVLAKEEQRNYGTVFDERIRKVLISFADFCVKQPLDRFCEFEAYFFAYSHRANFEQGPFIGGMAVSISAVDEDEDEDEVEIDEEADFPDILGEMIGPDTEEEPESVKKMKHNVLLPVYIAEAVRHAIVRQNAQIRMRIEAQAKIMAEIDYTKHTAYDQAEERVAELDEAEFSFCGNDDSDGLDAGSPLAGMFAAMAAHGEESIKRQIREQREKVPDFYHQLVTASAFFIFARDVPDLFPEAGPGGPEQGTEP